MAMIFNTQTEYNRFYDGLRRYAEIRLTRYNINRQDALDKAMDKVVNWLITNPKVRDPKSFAKRIIINSIKNSIRDRKVDPVYLNNKQSNDEEYQEEYQEQISRLRVYQIRKIR